MRFARVLRQFTSPCTWAVALLSLTGPVKAQAVAGADETSEGAAVNPGMAIFPRGDVFRPLIADPRERQFFASLLSESSPSRGSRTGSVGIGASVGIIRWPGPEAADGLQLGLSGGVFAQFDLTQQSHDLINADYLIGIPITFRRGDYAVRFRFYHQSSHLGDEFVENNANVRRLNLSFESFELLASRDFGPVRGYAGGEFRFNRTPHDQLEHGVLHGGVEYRHPRPLVRIGQWGVLRPVVAVDAQSFEQRDWRIGWSGRAGVEVGALGASGTAPRVSLLLELYDGPNPYGQFYLEDTSFIGFGAHFTY